MRFDSKNRIIVLEDKNFLHKKYLATKMKGKRGMIQPNEIQNIVVDKKSTIIKLQKQINELPFWVKQFIYVDLRENLGRYTSLEKLDTKNKEDLVQTFVPTPTPIGQRYIKRRLNQFGVAKNLNKDFIALLKSVGQGKTVLDICEENKWSLIQASKILVDSVEAGIIEHIDNNNIANTVYYLAGKIRLGEYLLRMNKVSLDQIDQALYTQHTSEKQIGVKTRLGELLVNLGFIKETDKSEIISLKEHSVQSYNVIDETETLKLKVQELERKMAQVTFENESLKQDLVDYQEELINKANVIVDLEQQLAKHTRKKFSLKDLFAPILSPEKT